MQTGPTPSMPIATRIEPRAGQRVTVMGLGRFGGGIGVTRWLAGRGCDVLVTDHADDAALAGPLTAIRDLTAAGRVRLRLGGHDRGDFTNADLVVASPAVSRPWENEHLRAAEAAGVPVTTEIRLVVERLDRRRVIGVTGTAGKSTTAAMIHHILEKAGHRSHLGGNIGGSLLSDLDRIAPRDWVVLELSSAMLHWLGAGVGFPAARGFSPHVAVLTNLAPNHLDWHGTLEHYERSKANLFAWQEPGDHQVRGADAHGQRRAIPLGIPGEHNQHNALTAVAAVTRAAGILPGDAVRHLADFPGLPHRLARVPAPGGLSFYDDSKSTTPQATVLAVRSFKRPSRVHLIAGGYDKGLDLEPIAEMAPRLAGLYTIGQTGPALVERAAGAAGVASCGTLDAAVRRALDRMEDGDVLLLSPGCASWDQFVNFEERGDAFRRLVEAACSHAADGSREGAGADA